MVNLSKSKYCALWQCPKMLWLRKYKPELAEVDSHTLSIMETGKLPRAEFIKWLNKEEVWPLVTPLPVLQKASNERTFRKWQNSFS